MDERRLALRNRMIGVLLRDARRREGRTVEECAEAIGVSESDVEAYEEGREPVSLPELEVLGYILDAPVSHFTDPQAELATVEPDPDFAAVLTLRHRIVGALLRKARLEAGMEPGDLADMLGWSEDEIEDYELGKRAIPVTRLEVLERSLDLPDDYFRDETSGPVAAWQQQREIDHRFRHLPSDVQAFVAKPINVKYLELAMKLSHMSASRLREIAEGLLEITY
jgi:transcriptional regulator with XRE-family HTH domain